VQEDHRFGGGLRLELEVDVAALTHVKRRKLYDRVFLPIIDRFKLFLAVNLALPE